MSIGERKMEKKLSGSHIDYSDIPPLGDEQFAAMTRFRDARDRLEKKKTISLFTTTWASGGCSRMFAALPFGIAAAQTCLMNS